MKKKTILTLIISALLLFYFIQKVGLDNLYRNLLDADPSFLIMTLILIPPITLIRIGRWFYLVRLVLPNRGFFDATKSLLGASLMAIVTPGKVGDLVRGLYYSEKRVELTALVIFEKVTDLFSYLALSIFMAFKLGSYFGIAFSVTTLTLLISILNIDRLSNLVMPLLPSLWKERLRVLSEISPRGRSNRMIPSLLLVSIAITLLTIYQFYLVLNAFGLVSYRTVFMVFPLSILISIIPITFGGLGVREGSIIYLLSIFHFPKESTMNASLFFYLSNVVPFLFGILIFPKFWANIKELLKGDRSLYKKVGQIQPNLKPPYIEEGNR